MLVLQIIVGLVIGGAFLCGFVVLGTRLAEHRRRTFRTTAEAQAEIRAIQRRTLRQLRAIADQRERAAVARTHTRQLPPGSR